MNVNVAGAGSGKTTKMADIVSEYRIPEGKILFCIAFTNAATETIFKKVENRLGSVPNNIKISTIHSFLYQEFINPYYYFLFGKHFEKLSAIQLPTDRIFKNKRLSELENDNILHYTAIPQKAKWVVHKKSGERKAIKDIRKRILVQFSNYCAAIFVDEAQDISEDVRYILQALNSIGVQIHLYGDPKQDVKGLGQFRIIINDTPDVNYIRECYRCPQIHLNLSNTLAPVSEQQTADLNNEDGSLDVVFENDINDLLNYLQYANYGLKYISKKNERFETHQKKDKDERFETIFHEVYRAIKEKWSSDKTDIEISRASFFVTERMIDSFDKGDSVTAIISHWVNTDIFDRLPKQRYAQIAYALKVTKDRKVDVTVVQSIESIKGLEDRRCLFILTTDLAPYLFGEKADRNKTSNLLYVALTRSLDHLTIMITKEIEDSYSRDKITEFFSSTL